jgi:glycosyltransferase involved in cell wall biosynthesis
MVLKNIYLAVLSIIRNISSKKTLFLVSEPANWSISEDCKNIQKNLPAALKAEITYLPFGLKNKIIHFASENTLLGKTDFREQYWYQKINPVNKTVLTWFHISDNDSERLHLIPILNTKVDIIHTASERTKNKLIAGGLHKDKIVVVPLGVDTKVFYPADEKEKLVIREKLGISKDSLVVGSFQKDGVGWGNGSEPKFIKGPDMFCSVIEHLAEKYPIHVILTGPARGYVKNRLFQANIPYTYKFLDNYADVAEYYRAIDLYFVCSREEGGPKALLESMASGIPIISTDVGMAPDIIENGINGFVVQSEDTNSIVKYATEILEKPQLRDFLIQNGVKTARKYSNNATAQSLYDKIYTRLL